MRPLSCPSCSSRGVRPSSERRPFDGIFRMVGRSPYRCLWCKKRSYLAAGPGGEERVERAPRISEFESAPPVLRRETPTPVAVAENARVHRENVVQKVTEATTKMVAPEMAPMPSRPEIRVPDAPPMYAEKGRLRLSGITLEQIQWRDTNIRRPKSSPRASNESAG